MFPYARANSAGSIDTRSLRTASIVIVCRHPPSARPHRHGGSGPTTRLNPQYDSSSPRSPPPPAADSKNTRPHPVSPPPAPPPRPPYPPPRTPPPAPPPPRVI